MKNLMWSHVDSDTETWPLSRDRQVTSYLLCDAQGFQSLWKLVLLLEQVGAGAQCSVFLCGVRMCTLGSPFTWAALWLPLILSPTLGDKVLSHRQFSYSTTTCIQDTGSQKEATAATLRDCANKCKLESKVNIKTIMETTSRVRRYSFSIR